MGYPVRGTALRYSFPSIISQMRQEKVNDMRFGMAVVAILAAVASGTATCGEVPAPGSSCKTVGQETTTNKGTKMRCETNLNTGRQYWRRVGM